jgi:hypothetical protein
MFAGICDFGGWVLSGAGGVGTPPADGASSERLLARALEVIERQSARIDELARW